MRPLITLLRITVLTACAIWLITRTPTVHAQLMNCNKFNTSTEYICNSCCTGHPAEMDWTDGDAQGAGVQVLDQMYANCGNPTSSCPSGTQYTGCASGNNPWFQAPTSSECCLPSGDPCNQGTCCSGLICLSSNECGRCIGTGQTCGNDYDCCSQNCTGGKCSKCSPGCIQNGNECSCCPIVLDTTGHGFKLTDIAHGVYFRWEPEGPKYAMSWTDPAGGNGWLVLPDKDGGVHDASNLFSSSTPQPKTAAPNGYIALAVYDLPSEGGNSNGWIDPGDKIYSKLRVWIDANQDGEAQPEELHTLDQLGVKRIGLRYHLAEKVDQYGNVFRYLSQVLDQSDPKAYDVWIKVNPDAAKP
jgi:hypothetical protein